MIPAFSTRNSIWPPLAAFTASATFMVTVPSFGFGISPFGPSTFPSRPTRPIMSGVAMQRSNSIVPPWTISRRSSAPTTSAPAARASSALAPRANTPTRTVFPVPFGRVTMPRTIWSAWRGSTFRLTATSTVSSNFALALAFTSCSASSIAYCFSRSTLPAMAFRFLVSLAMFSPPPLRGPSRGPTLRSCASPSRCRWRSDPASSVRRWRGCPTA